MIKVLIVEDSPVAQEFLTYLLSSDPEIQVVGIAKNGAEALKAVEQKRPDVITMDIHMPVMDGYEATRRIMATHPTPIVIVSGSTGASEVKSTFRAIEAGALAVVLRPPGLNHEEFESASRETSADGETDVRGQSRKTLRARGKKSICRPAADTPRVQVGNRNTGCRHRRFHRRARRTLTNSFTVTERSVLSNSHRPAHCSGIY